MRYVIYGAGAIGGLVGALLAEHGHDVVLIARGAHAAAIEHHGLTVESPEGRRVVSMAVATDPAPVVRPGDAMLLAMKSQDAPAALATLRRAAPPATPVACLQNGVDNERTALRLFPHVYGVHVMCPATHLEPGVILASSSPVPGLFDVGRYPAGTDDTSRQLVEAFQAATFDSRERPDIMRWKYRKLLGNLQNAVQACFEPDAQRGIARLARDEGAAVLAAAGIDVASEEEDRQRRGDLLQLRPVGGQRREGGSTWQSLRRGTGSIETDYLNGEIVLVGRQHGVATPVNELLQQMAWEMADAKAEPATRPGRAFYERLEGVPA